MTISILHRITGDGMAVVGGLALTWWLVALASGDAAYARFMSVATSPLGTLVMIGLSWAFFEHLGSGLRHLVLDMGAGYELRANKSWAILVMLFAPVATVLLWAWLLLGRAG